MTSIRMDVCGLVRVAGDSPVVLTLDGSSQDLLSFKQMTKVDIQSRKLELLHRPYLLDVEFVLVRRHPIRVPRSVGQSDVLGETEVGISKAHGCREDRADFSRNMEKLSMTFSPVASLTLGISAISSNLALLPVRREAPVMSSPTSTSALPPPVAVGSLPSLGNESPKPWTLSNAKGSIMGLEVGREEELGVGARGGGEEGRPGSGDDMMGGRAQVEGLITKGQC